MKKVSLIACMLLSILPSFAQGSAEKLVADFYTAVKTNQKASSDELALKIAQLNQDELDKELSDDKKRLAFWMNVYNSNIQYILKADPKKFEDRGAFFKAKQITVAGELLSFDVLEHGIMRKSVSKLSLGYLGKINVSKFERKFRVKRVNPRIHYALNCGALSCPLVQLYHSATVEAELDKNVKDYLSKTVVVEANKIKVPVLFSWFRADFGGIKGVKKFLLSYDLIQESDKKKSLEFLDYDWTLALDPYVK